MSEAAALVLLAMRRYPDVEPGLALRYFESDRRTAGLGALDERRRRGREVRNVKYVEPISGGVEYHMEIDLPARVEAPLFDCWMPGMTSSHFTSRLLPPVHVAYRVRADKFDLRTQQGRTVVALRLRAARARLREAAMQQRGAA